jgi:hypothetical protein
MYCTRHNKLPTEIDRGNPQKVVNKVERNPPSRAGGSVRDSAAKYGAVLCSRQVIRGLFNRAVSL